MEGVWLKSACSAPFQAPRWPSIRRTPHETARTLSLENVMLPVCTKFCVVATLASFCLVGCGVAAARGHAIRRRPRHGHTNLAAGTILRIADIRHEELTCSPLLPVT